MSGGLFFCFHHPVHRVEEKDTWRNVFGVFPSPTACLIPIVIKRCALHNAASHPNPDKRHQDEAATHLCQTDEAQ